MIQITSPDRVLFVDDMPDRLQALLEEEIITTKEVVYASSALKALDLLSKDRFGVIFLDHDLETMVYEPYPREITGRDVARAIVGLPEEMHPRLVILHSMNFDGALAMEAILREAKIPTVRIPIADMCGWVPLRADDSPPASVEEIERFG